MNAKILNGSRRQFIAGLGTGAALVGASRWYEPGVLANELERRQPTPQVPRDAHYEPVKGGIGASELQRRGRGPGPASPPRDRPGSGPGFGPGPGPGFGPRPPE